MKFRTNGLQFQLDILDIIVIELHGTKIMVLANNKRILLHLSKLQIGRLPQ